MSKISSRIYVSGILIALSFNSFARTYTNTEIKAHLTSKYTDWGLVKTKNDQSQNPSINLIKALQVFKEKGTVTVAVVDTGIVFKHPHLHENIYHNSKLIPSKGKRMVKKLFKGKLDNFGMDFSNAHLGKKYVTTSPADYHGHGTHVAGTIKNVYPNVKIIPIKYYNQNASGEQNLVNSIRALEYAVSLGVDIINYSGGGPEADSKNKKWELKVVAEAKRKGILLVAAAGNNGSNIDLKQNRYFPASYNLDNILSISAHDLNLGLISSSNYGDKTVHLIAPGHRIKSAGVSADFSPSTMTGTSQATAYASGVAALVMSAYPSLNYLEIKRAMIKSAIKRKQFFKKVSGGQINAYGALVEAAKILKAKLLNKKREVARVTR